MTELIILEELSGQSQTRSSFPVQYSAGSVIMYTSSWPSMLHTHLSCSAINKRVSEQKSSEGASYISKYEILFWICNYMMQIFACKITTVAKPGRSKYCYTFHLIIKAILLLDLICTLRYVELSEAYWWEILVNSQYCPGAIPDPGKDLLKLED